MKASADKILMSSDFFCMGCNRGRGFASTEALKAHACSMYWNNDGCMSCVNALPDPERTDAIREIRVTEEWEEKKRKARHDADRHRDEIKKRRRDPKDDDEDDDPHRAEKLWLALGRALGYCR